MVGSKKWANFGHGADLDVSTARKALANSNQITTDRLLSYPKSVRIAPLQNHRDNDMKRTKKSGGLHTIQLGTHSITFELLYSRRKTISIHLYPNLTIEVDAPTGLSYAAVEDFLIRRRGWLQKHMQAMEQRQSLLQPCSYVAGKTFRYLGQPYQLNFVEDRVGHVRLWGDQLVIALPSPADTKRVQNLLINWYRKQAKHVFAERLDACFPRVAYLEVSMPRLTIRTMKTRWGSCSSKGRIALNLSLIQAPIDLIDYVLLHELCHLRELNHSPRYWALMDNVLPDWKLWLAKLNQYEFGAF